MTTEGFKRKLTAILSADVAGYSRLMGEDEEATVKTITTYREVMTALINQHQGKVLDSPGDNLLAEFASVVDAVQCAVAVQKEFKARNAELPENRKMQFRIGINLGDVIQEGERIYGDGVNIAARLESIAEPGGICISKTAFDHIESKLPLGYEYLGDQTVKNIVKPVGAYRVMMEPRVTMAGEKEERKAGLMSRPRVILAGVLALLIAAGAVAIWNFYLRPTPPKIEPASVEKMAFPLPDKPSIAVLPFVNMSDDPKQEYFSDGITDDLITDLSKISGLFIISRNSVFQYKGKAVDVKKIGSELGVRYVLEGSVRKAEGKVRINAQLIDANTGGHIWAERYNRDLRDIFTLQDEVIQKIVTALVVKLTLDEQERLVHKGTDSLEAYDCILRGLDYFYRFTKEANAQARKMFERAIDLDLEYALAYSLLGFTHLLEWTFGWSQDPQSLEHAFELAQRAISLDESMPEAHSLLGKVYLWKKQYDKAIAELEKTIALNPNYADGLASLGEILYFAGRPKKAIGMFKKAIRLNPITPVWYFHGLGHAYFLAGHYEKAVAALKRVLNRNPNFWPAHIYLAASYIEIGQEDKARAEAAEVLRMNPDFSLDAAGQRLPYKDQAVLDRIGDSLRKTGLK